MAVLLPGWLSGKRAGIIFLLLAICGRALLIYDFFSFDTDMMAQGLAAKNLVEGHGIAIAQVHASDISRVVYEPESGWPPGYSFLVAGIYKISHLHIAMCCLLVCIAGAVFFLVIFRCTLQRLQLPSPVTNLLVLFAGFSVPDYVRDSFPTDLMSAACCFTACYLVMKILAKNEAGKYAAALGLMMACAGWLRFMYVPVFFIPSLFLIWNGWSKRKKEILRAGLISLAISGVLIISLFVFQQYNAGRIAHLKNPGRGFFPSNLLHLYPFLLSSFWNLGFYSVQLSALGYPYETWMLLFTAIGIIGFFFLVFVSANYLLNKKAVAHTNTDSFFMPAILVSAGIVALLFALSLFVNNYLGPPLYENWTYVSDRRYYCFIEFVILVGAAWWLFCYSDGKNVVLKALFIGTMVFEILHGAYVISRYVNGKPSLKMALFKTDAIKKPIENIVQQYEKKGIRVVFAGINPTFLGNAWLAGADCLYDYDEINGPIAASRPTLLVLFVDDRAVNYFRNFVTRKDVKKMMQIGEFHFYSCYIEPREQ